MAMLKQLRYRRLRTRLSLLAITALLWSQMLLALHADCASLLMSRSAVAVSVEHEDCAEADSGPELVVCQSHCSQGEGSPDAPRAPLSVPALPPALGVGITAVLRVAMPPTEDASSPAAAAWHRPTPHPASILLI